ncbi:hypothetical protein SERLA73DRAFT_104765 [Serpula lacrymans var. lacrymans S7.3]|uniref:Uncharacterized protein n=1 Tax=Serpula lacrymans var. lacrymans (strain S7.3) TaxID=936435 RepID=F8PR55_SERL3|nr:hypothetical protein SERLA73DRAFT_104765 [Serpula lacrymans var. lacrymans S7.3]
MHLVVLTKFAALDDEFRYWSFVETHPVHVILPLEARREAIDALNWSLTDRLQGSPHHAPPPFSQEECRDLLELLVSSGDPSRESDIQRAVHTRMVARILLRVVRWRQIYFRAHKPLPRDIGPSARSSRSRYSFPRAVVDVVVGIVCLGIPLLFADRARHGQVDIESGSRYAWPLLAIGGLSCLVAALILSASVTLMTLPGLDTISRIAGLVAIVCSTASMIASLMAFIRYKTDVTRPTSTIGGEGFVFITRRSMILSLPLVFLAYSIAGFVTGVVIYSFRGATVTFTSSGIPIVAYRFDEWMRWIIVGVLGTFAGVLIASTVLTRR